MKPASLTLSLCAACVIALAIPDQARASEHSVSASVVPQSPGIGQPFEYSVTVTTESNQSLRTTAGPTLPDGFMVVGRQTSQQIGRGRSQTITLTLRASRAGTFTIKGPTFQIGTDVLTPDPVSVEVSETTPEKDDRARPDARFFLETQVSPSEGVYVGQQVNVTYTLFVDANLRGAQVRPPSEPDLDDFWVENIDPNSLQRLRPSSVGGRLMKQTPMRAFAVFPLKAGRLTVDGMTATVGFGGLFRRGQEREISSEPTILEVKPLPEGAPQGFHPGNVGQWEFSARSRTSKARVGKPITIVLEVEGTGQINRVQLPRLAVEGALISEPRESFENALSHRKVTGKKTVEYTLTPTHEQTLRIPELEFVYFDPIEGTYETARSRALTLDVGPGELAPELLEPEETIDRKSSSSDDLVGELRERLSDPIPQTPRTSAALHTSLVFRITLGSLVLLLLGLLLEPWLQRFRRRRAPRVAHQKNLRKTLEELKTVSDSDSLMMLCREYIKATFDVAPGRINSADVDEALDQKGASKALRQACEAIFAHCEATRYSSDSRSRPEEVRKLANDLRNALNSSKNNGSGMGTATAALLAGACMLGAPAPGLQAAEPVLETDEQAIEAHQAGDYERAAAYWTSELTQNPDDPTPTFNLGLAHAMLGDYPNARLALERAVFLDPANKAFEDNRATVERIIRLETIEASRLGKTLEGTEALFWWRTARRIPGWVPAWVTLVALFLLVACMGARRFSSLHVNAWSKLAAILAVLSILSALVWGTRSAVLELVEPAILMDSADLRDGPSPHSSLQSRVANARPGTMFRVLEKREGWVKLHISEERTGWIRSEKIEAVAPQ